MLYNRIRNRNNRRFWLKIFSGQSFGRRKTYYFNNGNTCNRFAYKPNRKFNILKISLVIIFFIAFKLFTNNYIVASANESKADKSILESIDKVISSLDLGELEEFFQNLNIDDDTNLYFSILEVVKGNSGQAFSTLLQNLKDSFINELFGFIPYLSSILVIIIFLALIEGLKPDKFNKSLTSTSIFIGNLVIIGIVFTLFINLYGQTKNTVKLLTKEIEIVFPIILTLMTAAGGSASVSVFKPSVALLCNGVSVIFNKLVIPIIIFILAFSAINAFTDTIKTDKMAEFLKSSLKWIVGVTSVFFCFFVTAQGLSASIYDNVSIRALKYAVGNSIPLINSLLSSGFDVIVASCVLVKNALGNLSLLALIYIVAMPILKVVIFSLILRFLAAISQSIANDKTIKFLSGSADCVSYLATTISVVAMVYMITMLIVMCALGVAF